MTDRQAIRNGLLVGVAVGALICVGHLYWQLNRIGNYVLALQSLISERALQPQAAPSGPAAGERKAAAAKPEALESLRTQLQGEMSATRAQAAQAAQRAKAEALTQAVTHADSLARALGDRSQSQHQEITGELGQVKQTAATVSARIADVSTDLATIRGQMAAARLDLEHTLADLKRVRGDLGVQSGLIATNARELAALRLLGERNYFDFQIDRSRRSQRFGNVEIVLKKTNPGKGRFTVEVRAGSTRIEKKDKGLNEPLQFYVNRSHMPYEVVVNEVDKDRLTGYLSTPKQQVVVSRNF